MTAPESPTEAVRSQALRQRRDEIPFTRAADRGLVALPRVVLRCDNAAILALAEVLHRPGSKKLQGEKNFDRLRVRDYRVLDRVDENRLVVTSATDATSTLPLTPLVPSVPGHP